jgi:hypothetical protein
VGFGVVQCLPNLLVFSAAGGGQLLPALELVDCIGVGLTEHVSRFGGLAPVRRGDANIGSREALAVRDHFSGYYIHLALVRATSLAVLAHVIVLNCAHFYC